MFGAVTGVGGVEGTVEEEGSPRQLGSFAEGGDEGLWT